MIEAIGRRMQRAVGRSPGTARRRGPELSVVVPVFNVEAYLRECLDSVLSQSLRDLEVIVVDDGSTDGSPAIIADYASRDARVRTLRQENAGQGPARNLGVSHARGEFLAFLDADDLIPDGAYAFMLESLRRSGSDFSVGAARRLEGGELVGPSWNAAVHERDHIGVTIDDFPAALGDVIACNRMFRRAFWDEHVGGFPAGILYEDHVPMVTAFLRAARFDVLKRPTYTWRIREDGTSTGQQKHELRNLTDRVEVKRQALELVDREASEVVRAAWIGRVIDIDFAAFIDHALRSDDAYRAVLRDALATHLALAGPEAMSHIRVRQKVRSHLAALGAWNQLEVAQRFFTERGTVPATTIVDGRVRIDDDLPGLLSVELPPETLELSRTETRLQGCALHSEWVRPSGLRLTGWVIIRGVDLDRRSVQRELWLEEAGGNARIPLDVEAITLPEATEWAKWAHGSFDTCGFAVVIDTATLAGGGRTSEWRLRLRVSVDGVTREGRLHHAAAGSSAGPSALTSQRIGDGHMLAAPRIDPEYGLTISVRPSPRAVAMLASWRRAPRRLARTVVGRPLIEATSVAVERDLVTVRVEAASRWEALLASARLTYGDVQGFASRHERVGERAWRLDLPTTV
ncbi:MAG TPA: glycosyltransferase family 2 protein, partial [Candidatus Limnocylindria bacterium]